jgi:uncharacterized protein (DUF1919 family)
MMVYTVMKAIISNNCWGAGYYQERSLPFNTPTVGLWFFADDYIKFLQNFRACISSHLTFLPYSRRGPSQNPVGILGEDIEIQFLHYETEDEAYEKWTRRIERLPIDDDEILFKICDRDGFEQRHLNLFAQLPFKNKIAFLKRDSFAIDQMNFVREIDCDQRTVPDGLRLWNATKSEVELDFT